MYYDIIYTIEKDRIGMVIEIGEYYVDANSNIWSKSKYTKEQANQYSKGLSLCYSCTNCTYCHNCYNCENCNKCSCCDDCIDCTNCEFCQNRSNRKDYIDKSNINREGENYEILLYI